MKRVTALFTPQLHARLKYYALQSDRTIISIIAEAVEKYLDDAPDSAGYWAKPRKM